MSLTFLLTSDLYFRSKRYMVGVQIPFGYSYCTWLNKIQILVRESCWIVNFCLCRKFYSKMYTQTTSCLNYNWNNNNKRFVSASSESPSSVDDDGDRNMNFGVIGIWTWSFCVNVLFKAVLKFYTFCTSREYRKDFHSRNTAPCK